MPGYILTVDSVIQCPHGGQAQLVTSNTDFAVPDALALVETDVLPVIGCPFMLPGPTPSPCVQISWSNGSRNIDADGTPVLTTASVGLCAGPTGAPQGAAVVVSHQMDVEDD
jgi:hypothetical protein